MPGKAAPGLAPARPAAATGVTGQPFGDGGVAEVSSIVAAEASCGAVLGAKAVRAAKLTSGTRSATRTARAAAAAGSGIPARAATAAWRTLPSRHIDAATTPAGALTEARTSRHRPASASSGRLGYQRLADSSSRNHPDPPSPASRAITTAVPAVSGLATPSASSPVKPSPLPPFTRPSCPWRPRQVTLTSRSRRILVMAGELGGPISLSGRRSDGPA